MRYVPFGRSGLRVSELCLGGVRLGAGGDGIGEAASREVLAAFMDAGGTFIDTANLYNGGASEEMLGRLIAGHRDRLVVASKFGMGLPGDDVAAAGSSRKSLRRSVERSLRRLGTDHLDILYLHQWDFDTGADEVLHAMGDLVSRGMVDHIAVSNTPAWIVARCDGIASVQGRPRIAGMQIGYSLLERTADREVLPMADALELGLCCWAPLAQGRLAGAAPATPHPAHDRAIVAAVDDIARRRGVSMAQVALAWLRHRRGALIPVVGAESAAQVRDCVAGMALALDDADVATLDDLSAVDLGYPGGYLRRPAFENMRTAYQPDKLRSRHYDARR